MIDSGLVIYILETYGIPALIIVWMGIQIWQLKKYVKGMKKNVHDRIDEKDNRIKNLEGKVDNFHDTCHIPRGAIKKLENRVEAVEAKDSQIETDLKGMSTTLLQVQDMTTKIYDHFFTEGIKATNKKREP